MQDLVASSRVVVNCKQRTTEHNPWAMSTISSPRMMAPVFDVSDVPFSSLFWLRHTQLLAQSHNFLVERQVKSAINQSALSVIISLLNGRSIVPFMSLQGPTGSHSHTIAHHPLLPVNSNAWGVLWSVSAAILSSQAETRSRFRAHMIARQMDKCEQSVWMLWWKLSSERSCLFELSQICRCDGRNNVERSF